MPRQHLFRLAPFLRVHANISELKKTNQPKIHRSHSGGGGGMSYFYFLFFFKKPCCLLPSSTAFLQIFFAPTGFRHPFNRDFR